MAPKTKAPKATSINKLYRLIVFVALAFQLLGCNNTQNDNNKVDIMKDKIPPISDEVTQAILKIKDHRILFGHHSVGANILDGLRSIAEETGVDLKIEKISKTPLTANSKFIHFSPGRNTNPQSKIDGFADQMKELRHKYNPEVAFLKFCYIDFPPEANIEEILDHYKKSIEDLKKEHPETTFVHFTSPLTAYPKDIKNRIKRLLGLQVWGDASNIARGKYNNLLHKAFPEDQIFDIARVESTHADGSRETFTSNGTTHYSLIPAYTNDGGHLNTPGKRIIASELAKFLSNTISK